MTDITDHYEKGSEQYPNTVQNLATILCVQSQVAYFNEVMLKMHEGTFQPGDLKTPHRIIDDWIAMKPNAEPRARQVHAAG